MGFLDTPTRSAPPKKLSVEKVPYNGKTAWRYECAMKCDRHRKGACKGFIILVQDEPPKDKNGVKQCFYTMQKSNLEW